MSESIQSTQTKSNAELLGRGKKVKVSTANKPVKQAIVVRDLYDREEDYDVPHSGSVDEETGRPLYDEAPVPGGRFAVIQKQGANIKIDLLNAKGDVIDADGNILKEAPKLDATNLPLLLV